MPHDTSGVQSKTAWFLFQTHYDSLSHSTIGFLLMQGIFWSCPDFLMWAKHPLWLTSPSLAPFPLVSPLLGSLWRRSPSHPHQIALLVAHSRNTCAFSFFHKTSKNPSLEPPSMYSHRAAPSVLCPPQGRAYVHAFGGNNLEASLVPWHNIVASSQFPQKCLEVPSSFHLLWMLCHSWEAHRAERLSHSLLQILQCNVTFNLDCFTYGSWCFNWNFHFNMLFISKVRI